MAKSQLLRVDPARTVPIWSQIEEGLRRLIASGILGAGEPVPSVRDLARDLRVNPATVSKAYQLLTDEGLLEVRRGEGTFVHATPPGMARGERARRLREAALHFASLGVTLGASRDEVLEQLRSAWAELGRWEKGA